MNPLILAMSIDDDYGATAAALEVILSEQIRCEQDDGALHSAACVSGRGYEEKWLLWRRRTDLAGDAVATAVGVPARPPPAVPGLLGELAVAGAGHPGVPL